MTWPNQLVHGHLGASHTKVAVSLVGDSLRMPSWDGSAYEHTIYGKAFLLLAQPSAAGVVQWLAMVDCLPSIGNNYYVHIQ